jgi:hypothetical protein
LFRKALGYSLNLKEPKSFNEKIQWLKIYGELEQYSKYVDKYDVRAFVKEVIGEEYLIPLIGIYDTFEEIDFNLLPSSFVIKATHGSGWNLIVDRKEELDLKDAEKKIKQWLKESFYQLTGERNYRGIIGRILIEELLRDPSGDLKDYKFFCFDGKPKYIEVHGNRYTDHRCSNYDLEWNLLPVKSGIENLKEPVDKPKQLKDMLEICSILSKGFSFVRVDLYNTKGRIYFGELTFTPANGFEPISPREMDYKFGSYLDLNEYRKGLLSEA